MYRIYTKELIPREVSTVNVSPETLKRVYDNDPYINAPKLDKSKHIVVYRAEPFIHPILDNGEIREATYQEMVLIYNDKSYLGSGEIVKDGKIIYIPYEKDKFVMPLWNSTKKMWYEGADRTRLMLERKNKILKYAKLKKEIEELEMFSDEFESDETVALLKKQLDKLKQEINDLYKQIKKIAK